MTLAILMNLGFGASNAGTTTIVLPPDLFETTVK